MADETKIYETADALNHGAAEDFERSCTQAVQQNGRFVCVLSGGSTPKALYALLAKSYAGRLPWPQIHLFWGDERFVPPTDSESNYHMAFTELLSKVPVPQQNIHRVHTETGSPEEAANRYEQEIRSTFPGQALPAFDYLLLGLGENGHTASLFPHSAALKITNRLVVASYIEELKANRITMTVPLLNNARRIIFLVSGEKKATVLRDVREGTSKPDDLPSQLIRAGNGSLCWLLDRPAASLLQHEGGRQDARQQDAVEDSRLGTPK